MLYWNTIVLVILIVFEMDIGESGIWYVIWWSWRCIGSAFVMLFIIWAGVVWCLTVIVVILLLRVGVGFCYNVISFVLYCIFGVVNDVKHVILESFGYFLTLIFKYAVHCIIVAF